MEDRSQSGRPPEARTGTLEFQGRQDPVLWEGISFQPDTAFESFLTGKVAPRLADDEGTQEFEAHLRGLPTTGFGKAHLQAVLSAGIPEERDWAVGEAMAEAWLSQEHAIVWPWNMERDKRNARASLPGADLVGFVKGDSGFRLVLGEVKSSSEKKHPPQIMSGRSGHMGHQLDALARNLETVHQLLKWLLPRCRTPLFQPMYDQSVTLYFNSGTKAFSLFGVLIRDTSANEADLRARGVALAETLVAPTSCRLIALYLPYPIVDLPGKLPGRRAA